MMIKVIFYSDNNKPVQTYLAKCRSDAVQVARQALKCNEFFYRYKLVKLNNRANNANNHKSYNSPC